MTVQCIACKHFSMREAGQMAKQGYGHCAFVPSKAVFQSSSFKRQCRQFEAADQDTVDKRIAWRDWEQKRFLMGVMSHDET